MQYISRTGTCQSDSYSKVPNVRRFCKVPKGHERDTCSSMRMGNLKPNHFMDLHLVQVQHLWRAILVQSLLPDLVNPFPSMRRLCSRQWKCMLKNTRGNYNSGK